MTAERIVGLMKMHSTLAQTANESTSVGKITGYDNVNFLATVELQPADGDEPALQTGWLPIASPWIGNGWGMFFPPNIGDICEVHYQEGSLQNGYVGGRFFGLTSAPVSVDSGEMLLRHVTGSFLKFTNDGKVSLNGNVEIDVTSPTIKITCSTEVDLTAPHVKIVSPDVKVGPTGSPFQAVLLADSTPATSLQAF